MTARTAAAGGVTGGMVAHGATSAALNLIDMVNGTGHAPWVGDASWLADQKPLVVAAVGLVVTTVFRRLDRDNSGTLEPTDFEHDDEADAA